MESFISKHYWTVFILFVGLFGGLSFYAGYLKGSTSEHAQNGAIELSCSESTLAALKIPAAALASTSTNPKENENTIMSSSRQGKWVGSKNGTKYYTPGCPGAARIKAENYVWFDSQDDATVQGYSRGSC